MLSKNLAGSFFIIQISKDMIRIHQTLPSLIKKDFHWFVLYIFNNILLIIIENIQYFLDNIS
jgi:hypothetical protein